MLKISLNHPVKEFLELWSQVAMGSYTDKCVMFLGIPLPAEKSSTYSTGEQDKFEHDKLLEGCSSLVSS